MGLRTVVMALFLIVAGVWWGCGRRVSMAPLPPHYSLSDPEQVPIILLGEVLEHSHSVAMPVKSEWDGRMVQLWMVRVRVEQVLQGEEPRKEVEIFYFAEIGAGESPVSRVLGDLRAGQSELFFLQRDHGDLRTICEGWRSCIMWVRTGTHYNFQAPLTMCLKDVITTIFLSRGDHTSDAEMMYAIDHPVMRWGHLRVFHAFQRLAEEETSSSVRAAVLERLRNFEKYYGSLGKEPQ